MTDSSPTRLHPLRFGYFLVPWADRPLVETAMRVEELGLDHIGIQDHPYQRRYVDTWTLMSFIAARTSKVRVFPDVSNLPLRNPSIMAKAATTIGDLSGGRFDLGMGAGAFWDAIEAYGGRRRAPGESLEALEEAITVIRKIWSGERNLRFDGDHHHLAGAQGGPVPEHPIGIWLGAYGPRALELTGRIADGWVPSYRGDMSAVGEMSRRLEDAIDAAGREPSDVRRIINVSGDITSGPTTGGAEGTITGPLDRWLEELSVLATTYDFDTFVFGNDEPEQLDRFAREVMPAVREHLG